ncbi:MAG: phosphoribosyl-AMP cyclohydrolase [Deltaproteobacteria bacterium]|nr:phosphoribosyl-AMP cyclohydrolase [Deltaproteobacteria bacterium]
MDLGSVKFNDAGLVAVVVQARESREVLMLAWANADALAETVRSGLATFWSRSRGELWTKGMTSGNTMRVAEIRLDCDGDALLYVVDPAGPACHTGRRTCFYRKLSGEDFIEDEP